MPTFPRPRTEYKHFGSVCATSAMSRGKISLSSVDLRGQNGTASPHTRPSWSDSMSMSSHAWRGRTRPAKEATATIPIVMTQDDDPVATGFVASLARPGGNITGLSTLAPEIGGKRLELLKEIVPGSLACGRLRYFDRTGATREC